MALVVTIIVLLILAGISIAMLTGNNGIIKKAEEAAKSTTIGAEKDAIALAYNAVMIDNLGEGVTAGELQDMLNNGGHTDATVTGTTTLRVNFSNSGNIYQIQSDGKIRVITPEEEANNKIVEILTQNTALTASGKVVSITEPSYTSSLTEISITEELLDLGEIKDVVRWIDRGVDG